MFRRACRLPHRAIAGRLAAEPSALCLQRHFCMPPLASPDDIRSVKGGALLIDLRTPEEIIETPGPDGALTWDFRSDPTVPEYLLPDDKETPILLY